MISINVNKMDKKCNFPNSIARTHFLTITVRYWLFLKKLLRLFKSCSWAVTLNWLSSRLSDLRWSARLQASMSICNDFQHFWKLDNTPKKQRELSSNATQHKVRPDSAWLSAQCLAFAETRRRRDSGASQSSDCQVNPQGKPVCQTPQRVDGLICDWH